jgi:DNA mismatch endonuclease (patch repair protein)
MMAVMPRSEIPPPPPASSLAARRVMQANTSKDTKPEVRIRSALHARGLRFRKHAAPLAGLRCRADIVFRVERVAVFVDGCFWHRCPIHGKQPATNAPYWRAKIDRNVERDQRNNAALESAGWAAVRVWEHETTESAVEEIARQVLSRRAHR